MNDNIKIDVPAYEEERYKDILSSNKYLELKILVGESSENDDALENTPCVRMEGSNTEPYMIGVLYSSTRAFLDALIEDYPAECLAAELALKPINLGKYKTANKNNKNNKRNKKGD